MLFWLRTHIPADSKKVNTESTSKTDSANAPSQDTAGKDDLYSAVGAATNPSSWPQDSGLVYIGAGSGQNVIIDDQV